MANFTTLSDFTFAHISDLHAGYKSTRRTNAQGVNIREADGYLVFAKCVVEMIREDVKAVIVCGDIFHTPNPSIRSIVFVQNQFRKLSEAGIKVYALAGNHDTLDIASDISAARVLDDPLRGIHSTAEPYAHYELTPGVHIHLVSHHLYTLQQETMSEVKPIEGELNIFSTHGSVIDPLLREKLHTDQSPREIVIPDFLLTDKNWSYTLLGHIHERGWVGSKDKKTDTLKKKIYYNGSIVRRGFSDKEVPLGRGWTHWTIKADGTFVSSPRVIAQRPQVDFPAIKAETLSSAEITEMVIDNLVKTQLDGVEFDPRIAPILRQRIINISPSKYAALDWKNINLNQQHALQWSIKQMAKEAEEDEKKQTVLSNEEILKSGDIVQVYDDWLESSTILESADKNLRENIASQARGYIQVGQEATLDGE